MSIPLYQVDAFTSRPFSGNPAAVCLLSTPRPDSWLMAVAGEMNLSETAFLLAEGDGYRLRWFTPVTEEDLCGHATLASAYVLWEAGLLEAGQTAKFYTRSGLLTARRQGAQIELDFPATPAAPVAAPPTLAGALGAEPKFVGKSQFDYLVELEGEEAVRALTPDFAALERIPTRGVIVTGRAAAGGYDFVSRFFCPGEGIDEDPVTGSAHCCLAIYWSQKLGKTSFRACQASKRGGELGVELRGDRVGLLGEAVMVLRGELLG